MTQTSTAGCGCGCGGASTSTGGFVRPRFFAGLLLTEDDLQALTGYVTGKDKFRNRMLVGAGVVAGLEVHCGPCPGGTVGVRPGYAVDGRGNDIVVDCAATVDVAALVRDARIAGLGADCGDSCDDEAGRDYGLFIRYAEEATELITPFPTGDSCPSGGASPSRIRETYRFTVGHLDPDDPDGEPYHPWQRIQGRLGARGPLDALRADAFRLQRYGEAAAWAVRTANVPVLFDQEAANRYNRGATGLAKLGGPPAPAQVPALTEHLRALASALARHDLDPSGDVSDRFTFTIPVNRARTLVRDAAATLAGVEAAAAWPDRAHREVAAALYAEVGRVASRATESPELRLLAQGTPLDYDLRVALVADTARLRGWLLGRLDLDGTGTDCAVRSAVAGVPLPRPLPSEPAGDTGLVTSDLDLLGRAAATVGAGVTSHVTDTVCASLLPPAPAGKDADVLLARVELAGCDVVRICTADRRQALPGGPGYSAWASIVQQAWAKAEELCCRPSAAPPPGQVSPEHAVPGLPYPEDLLVGSWTAGELDELLNLLELGAPPPAAALAGDTEARGELAALRERLDALTHLVEELRGELAASVDAGGGQPAAPDEPGHSATGEPAEEPSAEADPTDPPAAKKAPPTRRKAPARRPRRAGDGEAE
jgi:hypothetical protein